MTSNIRMTQSENPKEPLVSVVVVTYNSAKTVIETLDSIKVQTYHNLELIISDDCSKDNTLTIVRRWLKQNEQSFRSSKLVTSEVNNGVAANINRGIKASKGEWVKSIAGDDLLTHDAVQEYISFVLSHPDCRICMAMLDVFGASKEIHLRRYKLLDDMYSELRTNDRIKQYNIALRKHIMPGPGIFYQKSLWEEVGGFDEKYSMSEEWPFELKVLSVTPIMLLEKKIVRWRQRMDSLSNNKDSLTCIQNRQIYKEIRRRKLLENRRYLDVLDCDLQYKFNTTGKQYYCWLRYLLPHLFFRKVRKIIGF